MPHQSLTTLWIKPQPSPRLQAFLITTHGIAGLAVLMASLPLLILAPALALLACSLAVHWRRVILVTGRGSCRQLYWDSTRQWHLQDGQSCWHRAGRYRVIWNHPEVILVQFSRVGQGPASLLLLADQVPAELHRQLRVRLTLYPTSQLEDVGM